jgi:hypothetical protein
VRLAAWVWLALAFLGCTPASSPTADSIAATLIDAGCLAASPDAVQSIAAEHILVDQPPWLACMYSGGTVKSCSVPCN